MMPDWTFANTLGGSHPFAIIQRFNGGKDIGIMFRNRKVGFVVSEDDSAEEIATVLEQVATAIRDRKSGLFISGNARKDQDHYRGIR